MKDRLDEFSNTPKGTADTVKEETQAQSNGKSMTKNEIEYKFQET